MGSKIKVIPASRVVKSSWGLFGFDLWFGVALGHVSRSTECLIRGPAGRREPRPIHHKHEFRLCIATTDLLVHRSLWSGALDSGAPLSLRTTGYGLPQPRVSAGWLKRCWLAV